MTRRFISSVLVLALLTSCSQAVMHEPVPAGKEGLVQVIGFAPNIRAWGDEAPAHLDQVVMRRIRQYSESYKDYYSTHKTYPAMSYLAISGGGYDGAFGAGILNGWTQAGTRPTFTIVTGVSAGALIAPFAFLGPEYDEQMKQLYTTTTSESIVEGTFATVLDGITGGLALADNSPLARKINETITQEMLERIGAEHRKGRRLLIGTTNLEAQRSVIWDIGSIANSGNPRALELFRTILLASAAVPGVVKPVFVDVEVEGKEYSEIHVDGGVTAQVFLYPLQSTSREGQLFKQHHIPRDLYIIRNAKITPEYKALKPSLIALSGRSLETLIKYQGMGDLYRLYVGARRDNINYHLMHVPSDFSVEMKELFDPVYMKSLFELGYGMGKEGAHWLKSPPGVEYMDHEMNKRAPK